MARYINLSEWVAIRTRTEGQVDNGVKFEDTMPNVMPLSKSGDPDKIAKLFADQFDIYDVRWNWAEANGEPKGAGGLQGHYVVGQAQVRRYPFLKVGMVG